MTALVPDENRRPSDPDALAWTGPKRSYDLVKEFVIALIVVTLLTVVLAAVFSSPDDKQITLGQWAQAAPDDFVATAATELDGTSGSATYGAPYTDDPSAAQKIGPLAPQNWPGVTIPVDAAQEFVVGPLQGAAVNPDLQSALAMWTSAGSAQQLKWASAYDDALAKATAATRRKSRKATMGLCPSCSPSC